MEGTFAEVGTSVELGMVVGLHRVVEQGMVVGTIVPEPDMVGVAVK